MTPDQMLANPIKIEKGQKISEPGVYDIDIGLYHTQCTIGHSSSSSGLRLLDQKSPLHYWAEYLDPERESEKQSESLILGRATHHLFLGEKEFEQHFIVQPTTYFNEKEGKDKSWNNNAKVCRDWHAEQRQMGLTVLTTTQLTKIEAMARMLAKEPMIKDHGLLSGFIERSLIWQDQETGIWLKARPDVIPPIENTIVDLKTIGTSASDEDCQRAIASHGYHMQLALVNMGMKEILDRTIEESILLFVETTKPHAYNIKPVDDRAIYFGECQIRRSLRVLAECLERDHWPTYAGNGNHAYLPGWTQKTLEQELEGGLLPDVMNPTPVMEDAE